MRASSSKLNPLGNFNFRVTFTHPKLGKTYCGFNSVKGIGVTSVFKEYREGGNNTTPDLILESVTTDPVSLTRGMSLDDSIYEIAQLTYQTVNGVVAPFKNRFDVTVQVMDRQNRKAVKEYELRDCVIENLTLGDLEAQGESVMIEGITLRFNELIKR